LSNKGADRRKLISAEARRILSLIDGMSVDENGITRDEQGRPFFPGRDVDFNFAHSGSIAAVSFVKGSGLRTGCDVEQIRRRPEAKEIAKEFFSVPEVKYIYQHEELSGSRFYEIWTLKECFLKLQGFSVFDISACPSFINEKNKFAFGASVSRPLSFRLYEVSDGGDERYILATAIEGEQTQPEIKWFSKSSLACKMTAEIKASPNTAET